MFTIITKCSKLNILSSVKPKTPRQSAMKNKNIEKSTLVLVTCGFIGVGFTLPFSFYISADAYWKHKWRIIEDSTQSFNLGIT